MGGPGDSRVTDLACGVRARVSMWRLLSDLRMPRWLPEVILLGVLYGVYEASRGLLKSDLSTALANGHDILGWETANHLAPEHALNGLMGRSMPLAVASSYYYAALHYVVTPVVLVWMYRRRAAHYLMARTSLVLSTALGLIGFYVVPTAPPRLLPDSGITDTLARVSEYGWWSGDGSVPRGLGGLSNQFAAMPSLHVGWALWCGVLLALYTRRWWLRTLGVLYPIGTTFVVLATGNHYLVDTVAGALTMLVGTGLAGLLLRLRRTHLQPLPPPELPTGLDERPAPARV